MALPHWKRDAAGYLSWDCHSLTEVSQYALSYRQRMYDLVSEVNKLDFKIERTGKASGSPNHGAKTQALKWTTIIDVFLLWADGKGSTPAEQVTIELQQWAVQQAESTLRWAALYAKAWREKGLQPPHGYWRDTACELAIIEGFIRARNLMETKL